MDTYFLFPFFSVTAFSQFWFTGDDNKTEFERWQFSSLTLSIPQREKTLFGNIELYNDEKEGIR